MTTSRTPDNFAEAARAAYDRLTASPLDDVDDNALQRYLPALQARMNNPHATLAQLAATMDPPLPLSAFRERLYRAIEVAGVPVAPSNRSSRHRPSHFADNARAAYDRLSHHRPATMTDKIHTGYLAALQAQMDNPHASASQLGGAMDPPMNAKAFGSLLLRAIKASQRENLQPTTNPVPAPQPAEIAPTTRHTYRSPSQFADAAQKAHDRLTQRRPPNIPEELYQRYLELLTIRMNNRRDSTATLAAAMDPPMSADQLHSQLALAIKASTRKRQPSRRGIPGPNTARQAADAAKAHAALQARQPGHIADARYQRLLTVLAVRMNNPAMTYGQLGAQLNPPLTAGGFYAALRKAHQFAGVHHTHTPHPRRAMDPQQNSAA